MKAYSLTPKQQKAMRASLQKQSSKASEGKHDERDIDLENSRHIDQDRQDQNYYWTRYNTDEKSVSFDEAIQRTYEELYTPTLKRINANYVKDRHPEKQKTMSEYIDSHRPEAEILQIGNVLDNVDVSTLVKCVNAYLEWEEEWNNDHGRPFETITLALHGDEATHHIHKMKAWKGVDKHGNLIPNREKALERAGVPLPNPDKKQGRYNNRNMTYTAMCRDKWLDICEEHGLDIIREPIQDVKGKKKGDYIREREKDYQERLESLTEAQNGLQTEKIAFDDEKAEFEAYRASETRKIDATLEAAEHLLTDLRTEKFMPTHQPIQSSHGRMEKWMKSKTLSTGKTIYDTFKAEEPAMIEQERRTQEYLAELDRQYNQIKFRSNDRELDL